ncbi:MAG: signal recognition particle-docking protein FtsY [Clostridiales bacterium]|jgi:fused signal recognition particle receptor|nr:signal recognition particle-docking protein FtsY [Clostridiales bacterium]
MSIFDKIRDGLAKTRRGVTDAIGDVFAGVRKIDESLYEELEEALIIADAGQETASELVSRLRRAARERRPADASGLRSILAEIIAEEMDPGEAFEPVSPAVILLVGVNGAGKTTTAGKLAAKYRAEGRSVLLAAADTFRAAAADQLSVWADRAGAPLIRHNEGSDPAAVVFDAARAAKARKTDILIADTAGRLSNKKNLMIELNKIHRVISREYPEASLETLLVLDAATGRNALVQAAEFGEVTSPAGVILTKLDGTAKGGAVIAVKRATGMPVRFVGVGEKTDDLLPFDAEAFAKALLEGED